MLINAKWILKQSYVVYRLLRLRQELKKPRISSCRSMWHTCAAMWQLGVYICLIHHNMVRPHFAVVLRTEIKSVHCTSLRWMRPQADRLFASRVIQCWHLVTRHQHHSWPHVLGSYGLGDGRIAIKGSFRNIDLHGNPVTLLVGCCWERLVYYADALCKLTSFLTKT